MLQWDWLWCSDYVSENDLDAQDTDRQILHEVREWNRDRGQEKVIGNTSALTSKGRRGSEDQVRRGRRGVCLARRAMKTGPLKDIVPRASRHALAIAQSELSLRFTPSRRAWVIGKVIGKKYDKAPFRLFSRSCRNGWQAKFGCKSSSQHEEVWLVKSRVER